MTVLSEGVVSGAYHATVSGEKEKQVQLHDEMGRSLTLFKARFEGERMTLVTTRSRGKRLPLSFQATRRDDRLEGEWAFVHPQYKTRGELHGMRVIRSPGWTPFEELRKQQKDSLLDISNFPARRCSCGELSRVSGFLGSTD